MKCMILFTLLSAIIASSEAALSIAKPAGPAHVVPKPVAPEFTVPKPVNPKPGVSSKTSEAIDTLLELLDAYNSIRDFIEAVQNMDDSNPQCAQLETRIGNCLHPNDPSAAEADAAEATACGDLFSKCGSSVVKKYESACPANKVARTAAQEQSAEDSSSEWTNFNESKAGSSGRTGNSGGRTHGGDPANGAGYKAVFPCELLGSVSLMATLFMLVFP